MDVNTHPYPFTPYINNFFNLNNLKVYNDIKCGNYLNLHKEIKEGRRVNATNENVFAR